MPEYLAYLIGLDGRLHGVIRIASHDDETAKSRVAPLVVGQHVELWRQDRFLARFNYAPKVLRRRRSRSSPAGAPTQH